MKQITKWKNRVTVKRSHAQELESKTGPRCMTTFVRFPINGIEQAAPLYWLDGNGTGNGNGMMV